MLLDLKKVSGLLIKLTPKGLIFDKKISHPKFQEKNYSEYRSFFKDKKIDKDKKLYYIYRNVCFLKDKKLFEKSRLSYDLTLIFPGSVGKETARTIGHFHLRARGQKKQYAEIYQVISGRAIFFLQNTAGKSYAVFKKEGEKIIIPPGLGHTTINGSDKPLVVANLFTSDKNSHDYSIFKKIGPAFYPIKKEIPSFEQNPKYKSAQIEIIKKSSKLYFGIDSKKSLYKEYLENPDKFLWLNNPDKFISILGKIF